MSIGYAITFLLFCGVLWMMYRDAAKQLRNWEEKESRSKIERRIKKTNLTYYRTNRRERQA